MATLRTLISQAQEDKRAELTAKLIELRNARRTAWLQFVAATFILVGAGTAAWVTFGQINQAQQQNRITLEGQLTDRYTNAIDQLGRREVDVRLGGIFALERIARDSPKDRLTVYEVLTAYVRGHSPWPPSQPGQLPARTPVEEVPALQVRAPDVQSALAVLGRRTVTIDDPPLDLSKTDLRRANLQQAQLQHTRLTDAQLQRAFLAGAQLQDADLKGAQLQDADLKGAQLQDAFLGEAQLQYADLEGAQLQGARFTAGGLGGALGFADADLKGAELKDARIDAATQWPRGFHCNVCIADRRQR